LAFPDDVADACTNIPTSGIKKRKNNKNKKVTPHMLTHDTMKVWVDFFDDLH
jgi:hypothetical protein